MTFHRPCRRSLQPLAPLDGLARFASLPHPVLLHSAAPGHPLSRWSFLAADPVAIIAHDDWAAARATIRATLHDQPIRDNDSPPFEGGWIGWLSYELGCRMMDVPARPGDGDTPLVSLALYDWVIAWNHATGDVTLISTGIDAYGAADAERAIQRAIAPTARWDNADVPAAVAQDARPTVHADHTPEGYRAIVRQVIEYVLAGDIFQANVAERFTAPGRIDPVALYSRLTARSPAPMAAFLRHGNTALVSASPEQFLRYDAASRTISTRPIKGTRPRVDEAAADDALAAELLASEKDRAENVMIVDLLRNDIARVARPGSVHVPTLCAIEHHPTVHHLVSQVTGVLKDEYDALDLLEAAFPGGSITGAPKRRAMEIIHELEPSPRGPYCGAIGWIGVDGSMDTSIAIRTIVVGDDGCIAHAGGGITARSDPDDEYQEVLAKAQAMVDAIASDR